MKPHIMLVDDDKDELTFFLDALKDVPTDDGFKCTYAADASQAAEILGCLEPDFIFVDFNMHGANGLQLLVHLKEKIRSPKSKIFLYSIYLNERIEKDALNLGAAGVVKKQYSIRELTTELRGVLTSPSTPAYVFSGGHLE
jgi:DNA-binding response OmpR family regulator